MIAMIQKSLSSRTFSYHKYHDYKMSLNRFNRGITKDAYPLSIG